MILVTYVAIPVVAHPQVIGIGYLQVKLIIASQSPACCERLPTLNDPCERLPGFSEHVHMVGHDAPRDHSIAISIEVQQRVLHDLRNNWMSQRAAPDASIEPVFDSKSTLRIPAVYGKMGNLSSSSRSFSCGRLSASRKVIDCNRPTASRCGKYPREYHSFRGVPSLGPPTSSSARFL